MYTLYRVSVNTYTVQATSKQQTKNKESPVRCCLLYGRILSGWFFLFPTRITVSLLKVLSVISHAYIIKYKFQSNKSKRFIYLFKRYQTNVIQSVGNKKKIF